MQQQELAKLALDNLNFLCYIVDLETFELLYLNNSSEENLTRIFEDKLRGRTYQKFLHDYKEVCKTNDSSQLALGKKIRKEIYDSITKKYYTHIDTLIKVSNKLAILSMFYDPELNHQDLESFSQKLTLEETLVSCIQTLVEDTAPKNAIERLLRTVAEYYGSKHAYVYELDCKDKNVYKSYEWLAEGFSSHVQLNTAMPVHFFDPLIKMFHQQGELIVKDLKAEVDPNSPIYHLFSKLHVNAFILVPFFVEGKLTYCMGVDSPTKNTTELNLLHSVVLFVVDKIRKNKIHQQLLHLSYSDILTGLWNRNKFNERIEDLENLKVSTLGYIYISINGLKKINTLYGEKFGDDILKNVAELLRSQLQTELYRLEGDEFIALLTEINSSAFELTVGNLKKSISEQSEFSLSVGSIFQDKKIDLRKGINQAYDIMYAEKQKFYASQENKSVKSRPNAVEIILEELRAGYYSIYLQPKVNLVTGEISSAEALIRKQDTNGQKIPPDRFVPIYEAEGTIRHIDFFVLEEVCKLLQYLLKQNKRIKIAVNFSRVTFISPNLLTEIIEICAKYKVPHAFLKIEITESIDKMDFEFFDKKLKEIKKAGFEISLDDFGAKHSNLLMLTMTEFSEVKIDKGLIDHITQSAQNRALVKNILKMINDLGTSSCVAEGIETKEQKEMIAEFGCAYGQGYYFYRPMPVEEFLSIYEENLHRNLAESILNTEFITDITLSYNEMSAIIDVMPICATMLTVDNKIMACNQCVLDTFGLESKEDFSKNVHTFSPDYQPNGENSLELAEKYIQQAYDKGYLRFPWVHKTKQGKEFLAEVTLVTLKVRGSGDEPLLAGFVRETTVAHDETSRREWVQDYGFNNNVSDKDLITTLLEVSGEWLWTYNFSDRHMMFFGIGHEEFGLPSDKFLFPELFFDRNLVYEEDKEDFIRVCENLAKGEHMPSEIRFYLPDGTVRYFRITYKIIKDNEGNALTAIGRVQDIDEQKKFADLFQVDDLTQCYNKTTTQVLIEKYINAQDHAPHALFVFDIDEFSKINLALGQTIGDNVLREIADELYANFREGDVIGRVGGDDFLVFIKNVADMNIIAEKKNVIRKILSRNYISGIQNISTTGSIGVALYPQDGTSFNELFKKAETSLLHEKIRKKKFSCQLTP